MSALGVLWLLQKKKIYDYGGFVEFTKMAMNKNQYTCEKDARVMQIFKKFDTRKYATEFQQAC